MNSIRRPIIIATFIVLQILTVVYWGKTKANYYIDELYSMGSASGFTGNGDSSCYIIDAPEFVFEEWMDNSDLKKYILMSEEERIVNSPPGRILRLMIGGRNYNGLLNAFESLVTMGHVSQWPGIILNIPLLLLSELFLLILLKRLNVTEGLRLLCVIMFGFSVYILSMALYTRFYMLVILLMLIALNLLYVIWKSGRIIVSAVLTLIVSAILYLSFMDSELTAIYFGSFIVCFTIALLINKRWGQSVPFVLLCLMGSIYVIVKTRLFQMLMKPGAPVADSVVTYAYNSLLNPDIGVIRYYIKWLLWLLATHFFAGYALMILFFGAVTLCILTVSSNESGQNNAEKHKGIRRITLVSIMIWLAFCVIRGILGGISVLGIAILFIVVVLAIAEAKGDRFSLFDYEKPNNQQNISITPETSFVMVVFASTLIYTVVEAILDHSIWRYYCFGFVSISIVFWYVIDRGIKRIKPTAKSKLLIICLSLFVFISALFPFYSRTIEYIYEDDRPFINQISNYGGCNIVLVLPDENKDFMSRHVLYDCVNLVSNNARILALSNKNCSVSDIEFPDEFILWGLESMDMSSAIEAFSSREYDIKELGADHISKAYVLRGN